MHLYKPSLTFMLLISILQTVVSQVISDTTNTGNSAVTAASNWSKTADYKNKFPTRALIMPGIMVAYGFATIKSDGLKHLNEEIKEEIYTEYPHKLIHADNYLQFAPAAAVYGLNAFGIKGKHNLVDRSLIYVLSNVIVNAGVSVTKKYAHQLRPDSSSYTSFPSGHTAEAFASAEFLRQEYKEVSPWYGVAGYTVAAATGYLRMYNNKHWFGDIVAGAGFGIASTKIAYWLYPKIQHLLFKNKNVNTFIMPSYKQGAFGLCMVKQL